MKNFNTVRNAVAQATLSTILLFGAVGHVKAGGDCNVSYNLNSGCISKTSGWASITGITGASTPYTISWSNGQIGGQFAEGFGDGTHSVTVTDANNCFSTQSFTIACAGEEDNCHFRTQTQGGWGTNANGNNPGVYRDANFAAAFPTGLQIGCTNKIRLTTSAAVQAFLPSGTTARALNPGTLTNPGQTYRNVLAGQLVALTLSVRFDAYDPNFGGSSTNLGDAEITYGTFQGWTVNMLLEEANRFIGGCGSSFSASALNSGLTMVNENYVDGTTDGGKVTCDKKKSLGTDAVRMSIYPNPATDRITLDMTAGVSGNVNIKVMDAMGRMALAATRTGLSIGEQRNVSMDISSLPNGTYMVIAEQDGANTVQRIVIAR